MSKVKNLYWSVLAMTSLLSAAPTIDASHVELVLNSRCGLGESPVWDADMKRLHFVDITKGKVHSFDPVSKECVTVDMQEEVGCVVPYRRKRLLAATVGRIIQVDLEKRAAHPEHMADLPLADCVAVDLGDGGEAREYPPGFRFNDGKCDPQGRLWVGTMNKDWRDEAAPRGKLYCLADPRELEAEEDPDGFLHNYGPNPVLKPRLEGVRLSNGMTWWRSAGPGTPYDTFYFIDSATQQVDAYDYDDEAGTIKVDSKRCVVRVPDKAHGGGIPDGMTIDSEGKLWVVLGEGGCVSQYDPATGSELQRVVLPVKRPTACTFGGDELDQLYVTTREDPSEGAGGASGGLFRVAVPGVRGLAPAFRYGANLPPPAPAGGGGGKGKGGKGPGKGLAAAGEKRAAEGEDGGAAKGAARPRVDSDKE